MTNKEPLLIEIRGRDKASNTYLCQIAEEALLLAGVEKVSIVNQHGEHLRHKPVATLLDIIENYDSNFFTSRIRIYVDRPDSVITPTVVIPEPVELGD